MKKIFAAVLFLFAASSAHALDSVSMEIGSGSRQVDMWRLGLQWNIESHWLEERKWNLYWDAVLGTWDSDTGSLVDVGLTPVFRYAPAEHGPYAEGGIGVHILSETDISSAIDFSTQFQFGSHLGAGYRFNRYDLSLRLQHLSNAGIKNPNPGINFLQLRLQYWLD
jgi:lipid A 3-O-deacylase